MKKEKEMKFNKVVGLNQDTLDHLDLMAKNSYMSGTGIMRMSIDYLYYSISGLELPPELEEVINDLRVDMKDPHKIKVFEL